MYCSAVFTNLNKVFSSSILISLTAIMSDIAYLISNITLLNLNSSRLSGGS